MPEGNLWVNLTIDDYRGMLIALVGHRFGLQPEKHLDIIRAERSAYMGKFVKLAGLRDEDTVLELGSGCGFGTRALAEKVQRVLACDISPAYLSVARQELADLEHVELHHVASRDLSVIAEGSVDAIVSVSVFIHFNLYDIYAYFLEFKRVLRGNGKVAFDFADEQRIGGLWRMKTLEEQFLEHAEYYAQNSSSLPGLVQWNSARGIRRVAELAGFRYLRRRGNKLLFARRSGEQRPQSNE